MSFPTLTFWSFQKLWPWLTVTLYVGPTSSWYLRTNSWVVGTIPGFYNSPHLSDLSLPSSWKSCDWLDNKKFSVKENWKHIRLSQDKLTKQIRHITQKTKDFRTQNTTFSSWIQVCNKFDKRYLITATPFFDTQPCFPKTTFMYFKYALPNKLRREWKLLYADNVILFLQNHIWSLHQVIKSLPAACEYSKCYKCKISVCVCILCTRQIM